MKRVLIIGMGKSGRAAAQFLKKKGIASVGVDTNPSVQEELHLPLTVALEEFDGVVVSPGVAPTDQYYREAKERGLPIMGEAQLALCECRQPCIAITGTNGKTTVTLLVEHVLKKVGKKARALGNIGEPLTHYFLENDPEEILVIELSSYQLETMTCKVFDVGVILNITPNHLDRYDSIRSYAKAKCRLQGCMKEGAPLYVYSQVVRDFGEELKCNYQTFKGVENFGPFRYSHERENGVAAWMVCQKFGVGKEEFLEALSTFQKPSHRIEYIAEIKGVFYFDDSKGTNIDATLCAVRAMQGDVVLIAGGVDKGASYAPWKEGFGKKVKKIIVLGKAADKITYELEGTFPIEKVATLQEAVKRAAGEARAGDSVLLSPGCSSFDMFRDYVHRGEEFKRFVDNLRRRKKE